MLKSALQQLFFLRCQESSDPTCACSIVLHAHMNMAHAGEHQAEKEGIQGAQGQGDQGRWQQRQRQGEGGLA